MVPNRLPSAIVVISAHWEEMVPTVKIISTLLPSFLSSFLFFLLFFIYYYTVDVTKLNKR